MKSIQISMLAFFLIGCSLAPDYQRPPMDIPEHYKEANGEWLLGTPQVAEIQRGKWWEIYADPTLNDLQEQLTFDNQDLKAAVARYDKSRALADVARSYFFPTLNATGIPTRQLGSHTAANPAPESLFNNFVVGTNLFYEVDVWGRVRNAALYADNLAQASAADLAFIDLSLHAQLASYYFSLRGSDLIQDALDRTVTAYEQALSLNRKLYEGGAVPVDVVYQSETQLETAKTLAADMLLQRAQFEHAIAVLIGQPPANFSLPVDNEYEIKLIAVKPDLPSTLLERRPDIAAAELRMQAANAEIGVARAAFFPNFTITSSISFVSQTLADLFRRPSLQWALGPTFELNSSGTPTISQILFDGGRIEALTDEAWADYNETAANYKQTVLNAFQDVEDSLVALHRLAEENQSQSHAARSAFKAEEQAFYRYKEGLTTYFDVAIEQTIALQVEISAIDIRTRYQLESVQLILALGGGWEN